MDLDPLRVANLKALFLANLTNSQTLPVSSTKRIPLTGWEDQVRTSTPEVLCDACGNVIPVMHPTAIFVTLRGPRVGHKKADLCDALCLANWAGTLLGQFWAKELLG